MTIEITKFTLGAFATNSYIIRSDEFGLVVDPGFESDVLVLALQKHKIQPKAILLTHAHIDHCSEAHLLQEQFDIPLFVHRADEDLLINLNTQARMFGFGAQILPQYSLFESTLPTILPDIDIEILSTPGHTPGSVCFILNKQHFFAGDTLFHMSIGRTDLPGGSAKDMNKSLEFLTLYPPYDLPVLAGHGEDSTLEYERQYNPYLNKH